jgi:hypothetical protein
MDAYNADQVPWFLPIVRPEPVPAEVTIFVT